MCMNGRACRGASRTLDSGGVFWSYFTGFLVFHTMTSEEQHVHVVFGISSGFFFVTLHLLFEGSMVLFNKTRAKKKVTHVCR